MAFWRFSHVFLWDDYALYIPIITGVSMYRRNDFSLFLSCSIGTEKMKIRMHFIIQVQISGFEFCLNNVFRMFVSFSLFIPTIYVWFYECDIFVLLALRWYAKSIPKSPLSFSFFSVLRFIIQRLWALIKKRSHAA